MRRPLLVAGVWLVVVAGAAQANGMRSHMQMSVLALERLPKGPLKDFLARPGMRDALLNGSYFPDSGYAAKDGYGELAHWEPFISGMIRHLRATHPEPTKGEGARLLAFILGVCSHSMGDQGFDSIFVPRSEEVDRGSRKPLDTGLEMIASADHRFVDLPPLYVPTDAIVRVMGKDLGHRVRPEVIRRGVRLARFSVKAVPLIARGLLPRYRKQMPWAARRFMDAREPGSLPDCARMIAAYWQVIWDRAHGKADLGRAVLYTHPADGGRIRAREGTSVRSVVFVFFGHNMDRRTRTDAHIQVTDAGGEAASVRLSSWGSQGFNTLKIRPRTAWAPSSRYTVTLTTGLKTVRGAALPKPVRWTFRTPGP